MGRVWETEKYMEHVTSEFGDYPSWICSDLPEPERPILSSNASLFPPTAMKLLHCTAEGAV